MARPVRFADQFRDHSRSLVLGNVYDNDLRVLIDHINAGSLVPERFYRSGIDRDDDELLAATGIKHLHLGGRGSDVLIFLVEYDDVVTLLEINDHKHFRTDPPGSLLRALYDAALTAEDAASLVRRQQRTVARRAVVRRGLKPRRPR